MKQPSPPQPPDPMEIARADAQMNRIDQITPFGSLWFGGPNRNRATLTFSPEIQELYEQQIQSDQNLLASALRRQGFLDDSPINLGAFGDIQSQIPGVTFGTPDLATDIQGQLNIPNLPALPTDIESYRGDVEQAIFDRSRRLMDPVFGDQQRALEQSLANRGAPVSGEAYDRDLDRFRRSRNEAYLNLADQAVMRGGQEASRTLADLLGVRGQGFNEALAEGGFANQAAAQLFGQNLAAADFANRTAGMDLSQQQLMLENQNRARSQALAEALGIRGNQFNELASLLGLQQVQAPGLNNFYAPGNSNVLGAYGLNQQAQQNAYNAQVNQAGLFNSGLFGLGGAFLGGPAFGSLFGGGNMLTKFPGGK